MLMLGSRRKEGRRGTYLLRLRRPGGCRLSLRQLGNGRFCGGERLFAPSSLSKERVGEMVVGKAERRCGCVGKKTGLIFRSLADCQERAWIGL